MKNFILSFLLAIGNSFCQAQSPYIDSLKLKLSTANDDTTKAKLLNDLSGEYSNHQ